MKRVYRAERSMPDIGAEPGDVILVEPTHPTIPLIVLREFGHGALAKLLSSGMLDGLAEEPEEEETVRSLIEPVSTPIRASTDQCAIFELLASVGCRMPPVSA